MMPINSSQFINGISHSQPNSYTANSASAELAVFWNKQMEKIESMDTAMIQARHDSPELPLARIKKIMKLDEDVKLQMISAEAPVLFAKAAELFIEELTLRAWVHTEDNKRKTLQKNDIAMAISKYDMFDFLIDIVPREEVRSVKKSVDTILSSAQPSAQTIPLSGDQLQFLLQHAQNTQSHGQEAHVQTIGQPIQLQCSSQLQNIQILNSDDSGLQHQPVEQQGSEVSNDNQPQVFQQVVGPDGTLQHIPIQLSQAQLQFLKMQFTSSNTNAGGSTHTQQQPAHNQNIQIHRSSGNQSGSHQQQSHQPNFVLASSLGSLQQQQQQQPTIQMQPSVNQPIFLQQTSSQLQAGSAGQTTQQQQQPQIIQLPFAQFASGQQVLVQQQLSNGQTVYVPMQQSGIQQVTIQQQTTATTTN